MFHIYFLVLIFFSATTLAEEGLLVSLEDGLVEGTYKISYNGRKFASFEGIPYASPPVQNLRYKNPEPVGKWDGILKATNTHICLQHGRSGLMGTEDCLYLNIYIPREQINPEERLDVIVHIHGGGFAIGSGHGYAGPSKMMDRDVVYVNFNYRLGPLGFMAIDDDVFSGNYGLKDQVMALRWVQRNVAKFGGNPDSVTITGISAGGASVHLQYFALDTKEVLFHRGWATSGTALDSLVVKGRVRPEAKKLITYLGCFDKSTEVTLRCMRQRSALQIIEGLLTVYVGPWLPVVPFGPVVELPSRNNPKPFMTSHPYAQLKTGQFRNVPLVISQTADEGLFPSALYYDKLDDLNKNWDKFAPQLLVYYDLDEEKQKEVSKKIKEYYLKDETITKKNFKSFVKMCTERLFHMGAEKAAKIQANASSENVYFMMLGWEGDNRILKSAYKAPENLEGVPHGVDAKYLYDIEWMTPLTKNEERMKDIYLDLLVAFAKTGVPIAKNITWEPVLKEGNLKYLFVQNPDDIEMKTTKQLGPFEFWRSLGLNDADHIFNF